MQNHVILTPFFLDEYLPGLDAISRPAWRVNHPPITNPSAGKEPSATEVERRMSQIHKPLAEAVAKTVSAGARPVSIAGDCCTSIGVLAGLQLAGLNPLLIWFDAHGDFNTWQTTPSGFLGGMPLAMLTGRGELTLGEAVGLKIQDEERVWLVGARDLDPGEIENLKESQVVQIPRVKSLTRQNLPPGPIWVHFDTDVLRLKDAPAMNYPAKGGPSLKVLKDAFDFLAASGRVAAVSMSTWNPDLDVDGGSRRVCMTLLKRLLA